MRGGEGRSAGKDRKRRVKIHPLPQSCRVLAVIGNTVNRASALLFLLALPVAAAWADDKEAALRDKAYTILRDSPEGSAYHEDEVPLNPGKGWYALFQEGSRSRLVAATLTGRRAYNVVDDSEKGPFTGVEITASPPEALVYLRHPSLRVGDVPSVVVPQADTGDGPLRLKIPAHLYVPEWNGQEQLLPFHTLEFGKHTYQLSARIHAPVLKEYSQYNSFSLLLSLDGGRPITITTNEIDDEQQILLPWAGDLNQDGFLDFIVKKERYNNGATCWYLSRKSQPLSYEAIGCHGITGC
jgi:hypothetical protein